jgi:hypothetical protein
MLENLGRSREPSPGGIPEFPLAANLTGNFFRSAPDLVLPEGR